MKSTGECIVGLEMICKHIKHKKKHLVIIFSVVLLFLQLLRSWFCTLGYFVWLEKRGGKTKENIGGSAIDHTHNQGQGASCCQAFR